MGTQKTSGLTKLVKFIFYIIIIIYVQQYYEKNLNISRKTIRYKYDYTSLREYFQAAMF